MNLPDIFHQQISSSIEENGVFPHQMLTLNQDDKLGVFALAYNEPINVMNYMLKELVGKKPKELIYGMDRFTKKGQGTTLGDIIGGAYWNGDAWRIFIIEYQHEPRIVKPLDWDNVFWKQAIKAELMDFLDKAFLQKVG